ncbi:unnamed protein product [Meganyctiphanes norvegica]|uniref:Uncharacterized protein n=1 Tax=Meganyctiphanes norvegica TaxID=48144 RepID=A0AAV2QJN4_MEGNR
MECHNSLIDDILLELLDPNTTPEKALETLSYPCISHEAYLRDDDHVLIFLAYMRFIMTRLPAACVEGIWEELLKKTLMYSLGNFSHLTEEITCVRSTHAGFVLADDPLVSTWLQKALVTHNKCPNPYIRLELFRLIRILLSKKKENMSIDEWECLCITLNCVCETFIHTISKIQPHHLYPSDGDDKVLFDFTDLRFIFNIYEVQMDEYLQKVISNGIIEYWKKDTELDVDSDEAGFIAHCIQLIGIFTVRANSIPDPVTHMTMICYLCNFFKYNLGKLIFINGMKTPWDQFQYVLSQLPFKPYITATINDLRSAVCNKCIYSGSIATRIDSIAQDLGVYTKTYDLPRLLFSRQVHGPTSVQRHALLTIHLSSLKLRLSSKTDSKDDDAEVVVVEEMDVEVSDTDDSDNDVNDNDVSDVYVSDTDVSDAEVGDEEASDAEFLDAYW